jgi:hypothetical protein
VVLVLAVGAFLFVRSRGPVEEEYYHFRCPGCRRRLRYRAKQIGHKGQCSHCGRDLVFPHTSESVD